VPNTRLGWRSSLASAGSTGATALCSPPFFCSDCRAFTTHERGRAKPAQRKPPAAVIDALDSPGPLVVREIPNRRIHGVSGDVVGAVNPAIPDPSPVRLQAYTPLRRPVRVGVSRAPHQDPTLTPRTTWKKHAVGSTRKDGRLLGQSNPSPSALLSIVGKIVVSDADASLSLALYSGAWVASRSSS
jgi:hypothetical protein